MKKKILTDSKLISFKTKLLEDEKSLATLEKYMRDIAKFLRFCDGRALDKALVLEFKIL